MRPLARRLENSLRHAVRRSPKLVGVYRWLKSRGHEIRLRGAVSRVGRAGNLSGANVVWIFGSGRSGSTWLRSMMGEMQNHRVWEEPMVGRLFGEFHESAREGNLRSKDFIMGDPVRAGWIHSIRNFILDGARYSHPGLRPDEYLIVKEPNGSVGAPLIMQALPESRMILLIRDPRDVVASTLDGARGGNWLHEWRGGAANQKNLADERPDAFVRRWANVYRRNVQGAWRAYEAHRGRKALIRYEDLRADAPRTMRRVYSELEIPVNDKELARIVERYSWENIPERERGEGKFYRKANPGSWREDLTPSQIRIVEEVTAPVIERFYPAG